MVIKYQISKPKYNLHTTFEIAHGKRDYTETVSVKLEYDNIFGIGECMPYPRYGETTESVVKEISTYIDKICKLELQAAKLELQKFPSGAARNAIDIALWDLLRKAKNKNLWDITGFNQPKDIYSAYTITGSPDNFIKQAKIHKNKNIIKIKFIGDGNDNERLLNVRKINPNCMIVVDANESLQLNEIEFWIDTFTKNNVDVIEQPFKANSNDEIEGIKHFNKKKLILDICADESCHTKDDVENLKKIGYSMVNIKLDKTGGITGAIDLLEEARRLNLKVMVGCMTTSSAGIIPAYLTVAQEADLVDLDAPLLIKNDIENNLKFEENKILSSNFIN